MRRSCFVYILADLRSARPVLYTGVTNDLARRLSEHRLRPAGFVAKYHVDSLVYYECFSDVVLAIARETQIKGWSRAKKLALIAHLNPALRDLAADDGTTP